jgi:hypothetical protein
MDGTRVVAIPRRDQASEPRLACPRTERELGVLDSSRPPSAPPLTPALRAQPPLLALMPAAAPPVQDARLPRAGAQPPAVTGVGGGSAGVIIIIIIGAA